MSMKFKPLALTLVLGAFSGLAFADHGSVADVDISKAKLGRSEAIHLDRNQGQAFSFGALPMANWANTITISGLLNVDLVSSNRTPVNVAGTPDRFGSANPRSRYSEVTVSNANVFVDALVNCWTRAHVGLVYNSAGSTSSAARSNIRWIDNSQNWSNLSTGGLDEAYAVIGNFAYSPIYLRAGRQYVDFGVYDRTATTASFTQMLSQTHQDALTVGFMGPSGMQVSAYTFRGLPQHDFTGLANTYRRVLNNGGLHVAYVGDYSSVTYDVVADYIYNLVDADIFGNNVQFGHNAVAAAVDFSTTGYSFRTGGMSVHVGASNQVFDGSVDYVSSINRFSSADLAFNPGTGVVGAKPTVWAVDAGYSFSTMGLPSRIGMGFQNSEDLSANSATVGLFPKNRYLVNYGVELGRNTDVKVQLIHDKDYSTNPAGATSGGTSLSSTTALFRLGVKFA